jgi:O-antigen ligase
MKSGLVVAVLVGLVMLSPLKDTFIDYLPFVGTVEAENVQYRQRLMQASFQIILQNPWFGTYDYMYQLIDQDLVIGGMVDIVNTYVGIGLGNGLTGLFSFIGVFLFAGLGIIRSMAKLPDPECEERTIGQGLLAALVGTAVTIATVSSISFIPLLYWLVAGLGVGYCGMVRRKLASMPEPAPAEPSVSRGWQGRPQGRARTA